MAVIVKYIVVRNGEEKMTFATKKEADAHDKMLDVADNLFEFLETTDIKLNEQQLEDISLLLAENRAALVPILKGQPAKKAKKVKAAPKQAETNKADDTKEAVAKKTPKTKK